MVIKSVFLTSAARLPPQVAAYFIKTAAPPISCHRRLPPVTVKVALFASEIFTSGEEKITKYTTHQEPFGITTNTVSDAGNTNAANGAIHFPSYLPLLLGLAGLIILVWAIYQRYGSRIFHIKRLFRRK